MQFQSSALRRVLAVAKGRGCTSFAGAFSCAPWRLLALGCLLAVPALATASSDQPVGTAFLNHGALVADQEDPAWFLANIPFLDVPDREIQQVYYYRWMTYREHLVYTGPVGGWLSTEFLTRVPYAAPYGGINAAAGHQIIEGRWLRDPTYVHDLVNYWLNGPGQMPKPRNQPGIFDWAHNYSFWAGTAVWQLYLAQGDRGFAVGQLPQLVRQYRGWDTRFDRTTGLYWQSPAKDGTEYSPASYESDDDRRGGAGYRPTINAFQYGDALGIAAIARLAGDKTTASRYAAEAGTLRAVVRRKLWDPERKFFYEIVRDGNPEGKRLDTRVEAGFVPWAFGLPELGEVEGFRQLFDPQGFAAKYGPTSVERRSRWFNHDIASCCRWTGPSWPYQTAHVLTGMENLLNDYGPQDAVTRADYVRQLRTYARTQFNDGKPYIAEAHDSDEDRWIYDKPNHSEDYNHSTYVENVIAGLIGLRAQPDDTLVVAPLAPTEWDWFALEGVPYHGHDVTVLWDRTGSRYRQGAGFRVYLDGKLAASRPRPGHLTVSVGAALVRDETDRPVNAAANPLRQASGPQPIASYELALGDGWKAIDGSVFRVGIPPNSRWVSLRSPHAEDHVGVDFGQAVTIGEVRITFYDDGKGVRVPGDYRLEYWQDDRWLPVPGQTREARRPIGNAVNIVRFPALAISRLRVVAANHQAFGWGVSEIAASASPIFAITNLQSGTALAPWGSKSGWRLRRQGDGHVQLLAPQSGRALTMAADGKVTLAPAAPSGRRMAAGQLWLLQDIGAGRTRIVNATRQLQLTGSDTSVSAPTMNNYAILATPPTQLWLVRPMGG